MKKTLFAIAALLCTALLSFGQQIPQLPNDPEVKVGKLENGMTYYIRHNDKPAQRAEFYLATHVGALQETPDQDGLAHFLEHMCFNGTKNFPGKGIINWLESIGASFGGNVNASTGVEQTVYLLNNIPLVRPSVVDTCLLIMHDYSHFVTCDPSEIDAERGVILEEKRTRNTASWRSFEKSGKYYYGDTKYATTTVIGSEENLKTFKPESLTNFYHTWYVPCNQALIVVGDINVDEVEAKIISTFADIPAPENPAKKDVIEIPDNEEPIIGIITDPEETNNVLLIGWKSKARPKAMNSTPYGLLADLAEDIVSIALNERLADIAAKPDAPFLQAFFLFYDQCETMDMAAARAVFKNGSHAAAMEGVYTEIEKMRRYGFSDGEIERAKSEILSRYEAEANKADTRKNSEFVYPMIYNFFGNHAFMTPQAKFETVQDLLPQLTPAIINQIASAVVTKNNMVVIYNGVEGEGAVIPTEQEFKDILTKVQNSEIAQNAGEEIPSEFIDPSTLKGCKAGKTSDYIYGSETFTLKNGLKVILLPTEYEKDKITIKLQKKGGYSIISDDDMPSFDSNIWEFYCRNTGVADFSATTVAKILSGKQLYVAPYIRNTTHGITANTTRKDLETAFQLCYLALSNPRFDETEYNQGIKQIAAVLPNLKNNPDYGFQVLINESIYEKPSRHQVINEEILSKANLATLERVCKEQLFNGVDGATLFVVGDFDKNAVAPMVQKYFGSLAKGNKASDWTNIDGGFINASVKKELRTKLETPKAKVFQFYEVEKVYSIADDVALDALIYIVKMVYTQTLREDEGGTYGARVDGNMYPEPLNERIVQVSFDTNPQDADKLRALAIKGFKDIAENGPDAEMFDKAVKNLKKMVPEKKLRNSYWMTSLQNYELYGMTIEDYEASIDSLTPEMIKALAADFVNNGGFSEIVMLPAE